MGNRKPELDSRLYQLLSFGGMALLLIAIILLINSAINSHSAEYRQQTRGQVEKQLNHYMAEIEEVMNQRLSISKTLEWVIGSEPLIGKDKLSQMVSHIYREVGGIHGLSLVKKSKLNHIYPPELKSSLQATDITTIIEAPSNIEDPSNYHRMILDGPMTLSNGTEVIIVRSPIFTEHDVSNKKFWGMSNIILDWDYILEATGLSKMESGLEFAMRTMDDAHSPGRTIIGNSHLFEQDPAISTITLTYGDWQLAALPNHGWPESAPDTWIWQSSGLFVVIFAITLGWIWSRHSLRLRSKFEQSTTKLLNIQKNLDTRIHKGSEREKQLHDVIRALPIPVTIAEIATGENFFSNKIAEKLFELPPGSRGQNAYDYYVNSEQRDDLVSILANEHHIKEYEAEMRTSSGNHFWALISAVLIEYEGKRAILSSAFDITQRKHMESAMRTSEENFRAVFETMPLPMAITLKDDGLVKRLNPAAVEFFGVIDVLTTQLRITDYYDVAADRDRLFMEIEKNGYVDDFELSMHNHTGESFYLIMSAAMLNYNGTPALLTIFNDISDRKQMETELHEAIMDANVAIQAKNEFLATMSHEIRTPLNGALSMSRLLERTALTAEQREYVNAINFSSETLLTIISDILDLSIIEAGKLQLENTKFELRPILENMINLLSPKAKSGSNNLTYHVDQKIPPVLSGDPTRLRQLLFNLIGNALKFTENGEISIRISTTDQLIANDRVSLLFEINDNGIGIAEDIIPELFESFTQADSSINRRFGGSGLGLAICQHIIAAMGGEIGVTSREGEGSTFWFRINLPYSQLKEISTDHSLPLINKVNSGLDILLVEDDPINQRAESALLKQDGHKVTVANDGYDALQILSNHQSNDTPLFDLILMDVRMPGLNGMETTRCIREMPEPIGSLPIIALTADITQQNIDSCLAAGMNKVLSKPIRHNELSQLLASISPDS